MSSTFLTTSLKLEATDVRAKRILPTRAKYLRTNPAWPNIQIVKFSPEAPVVASKESASSLQASSPTSSSSARKRRRRDAAPAEAPADPPPSPRVVSRYESRRIVALVGGKRLLPRGVTRDPYPYFQVGMRLAVRYPETDDAGSDDDWHRCTIVRAAAASAGAATSKATTAYVLAEVVFDGDDISTYEIDRVNDEWLVLPGPSAVSSAVVARILKDGYHKR